MKILIALNTCYPGNDACSNLVNNIIFDTGLSSIYDFSVICRKSAYNEDERIKISDVDIYKTISYTMLSKGELHEYCPKIIDILKAYIEKIAFKFKRLLVGEALFDIFEEKAFYEELKKINASSFDIIVSISGGFSHSLGIAKYCKKTNTPFIFYQVDPCATNHAVSKRSKKMVQKKEHFIYDVASKIITTDLIVKEVKAYYSDKILKKFISMELPLVKENKRFEKRNSIPICSFTGNIYGGIRNPAYTFRLFETIVKEGIAELLIAGTIEDGNRYDCDYIRFLGKIQLNESLNLIASSDFLVNIGNSVDNQVPSKIFDYISSGKPIINVYKNPQCPSLKYINKYPYALNLLEDEKLFWKQTKELKDFIVNNVGNAASFEEIEGIFRDCTPEYFGKEFRKIVEELIR